MPQTRDCDFCGDEIEPGTGTMFVRVDGTVIHYCSSKCEKNADLGREARDVEWTEAGRRADEEAARRAAREAEAAEQAREDEEAEADDDEETETDAEEADADDEAETEEAEA